MNPPEATAPIVTRIVGVYDANGSLTGELSYWVKTRLGKGHCALCEITHGAVREKREWKQCRIDMGLPFETVHLDERDPALLAATTGATPCVVAEVDGEWVTMLDTAALEECAGSPTRLRDALESEIAARGWMVSA